MNHQKTGPCSELKQELFNDQERESKFKAEPGFAVHLSHLDIYDLVLYKFFIFFNGLKNCINR